jgi:hypothetical protein
MNRRQANGLCRLCAAHLEKQRARRLVGYHARKDAGLCVAPNCVRARKPGPYVRCATCHTKSRAYQAKWRAARAGGVA